MKRPIRKAGTKGFFSNKACGRNLLLALLTVSGLLTVTVAHGEEVTVNFITYYFTHPANLSSPGGRNATITGVNTGLTNEFGRPILPEDFNIASTLFFEGVEYVVTGIGEKAFMETGGESHIVIPNTITTIGKDAFASSDLRTINLGNTLTTIGDRAFCNTRLTYINLPPSLTTIGSQAFAQNESLNTVRFSEGLASIGSGAFEGCAISSFTILKSIISIGENAFANCTALTTVNCVIDYSIDFTINPPRISIGQYAFKGCTALTTVSLPAGIFAIGEGGGVGAELAYGSVIKKNAFQDCAAITSITLYNSYAHTLFLEGINDSFILYVQSFSLTNYRYDNPAIAPARIQPISTLVTVTFDANGGVHNADSAQTFLFGNMAELPDPDPTYDKYSFAGWYSSKSINPANATAWDFNTHIFKDTTLYAAWTLNATYLLLVTNGTLDGITTLSATQNGEPITNKIADSTDVEVEAFLAIDYTFDGWYKDNTKVSTDNPYIFKMPAANLHLEARAVIKNYTLILNTSEGIDAVTGGGATTYKSKRTAQATIATGYTFTGWYDGETKVSDANPYTFDMPLEDITLQARADINSYTLHVINDTPEGFDTIYGSGSKVYKSEVEVEAILLPEYSFVGWYSGETKVSSANPYTFVMPLGDITLQARAIVNSYTLNITHDEGFYASTGGGTKAYKSTASVTAFLLPGYTFVGWYDGDSLKSTDNPYIFTMPLNNLAFQARTDINSYTLTLNKGEGINTVTGSGSKAYKSEVTVQATVLSNYTFAGWYNGATRISTDNPYTFTMPLDNITLEARVYFYSYLTLSQGPEGFISITGEGYKQLDDDVTISAYMTTGYTFTGWYDGETLISTANPYTFTMPNDNLTLQARSALTAYTLNITIPTPGSIIHTTGAGAKTYQAPVTLTADIAPGYTFDGWYDGNTRISGASTYLFHMPPSNLNLEARVYSTAYPLTLTIDNIQRIAAVTGSGNKAYNTPVTINATLVPGYTFDGWYDGENCLSTENPYTFAMPIEHLNLQARAVPTLYDITYIGNDGNHDVDVTFPGYPEAVPYGTVLDLPTPSRYGGHFFGGEYVFNGWYTESVGGTKYDFPYTVTGPLTLYAQWLVAHTVTFHDGVNTALLTQQTIPHGELALKPIAPVRSGYFFIGWGTNPNGTGEMYNFNTPVTANLTLYAQWSDKAYDVTFKYADNGATPVYVATVGHGAYVTQPANPVRSGYFFVGWFTASSGGTLWEFDIQPITQPLSLYAQWQSLSSDATLPESPQSSTALDNINGDGNGATYYDLQGHRVTHPEKGRLYIIIYSTGERRLIIK